MKIALDTNVLVRILINDEPEQTKIIRHLIKYTFAKKEKLFVSALVILETNWVLKANYKLDRSVT